MSSIDLVQKIIGFIEDSGLVNAGVGSHLNINKQAEMDASLLSFKGNTSSILQASVTGVDCINNPIKICKEMINLQELQFKSLIQNEMHAPNFIAWNDYQRDKFKASMGEYQFVFDEKIMYTQKKLKKYKQLIESREKESNTKESNIKDNVAIDQKLVQDTIGVILIAIDSNNEIECVIATSSGGPWLKEAGRIGSKNTGLIEHNLMKKLAARPLIWD
eukprot:403332196